MITGRRVETGKGDIERLGTKRKSGGLPEFFLTGGCWPSNRGHMQKVARELGGESNATGNSREGGSGQKKPERVVRQTNGLVGGLIRHTKQTDSKDTEIH